MVKNSTPPGVKDEARRTINSEKIKSKMYWKKYSYETQGAYTEMTGVIGPGYSNPKHYHTQYAEHFTALKGSLTVTLDGKRIKLNAGDSATVEIGHVHSLINDSGADVEYTVKLVPGSEGFEQGMYIVHGMANDGITNGDGVPNNPVSAGVVAGMMDTWLMEWTLWLARPLLFVLRRYGEGTGHSDKLIAKYWE